MSRHPRKCRRSRSRFTQSPATPVSRRFVWLGRSYAADWRNSPPSTPCSSSKSCVSSFQGGLPANSTKRLSDGSVAGARQLAHVASSSGPRRIVGSVTNREVGVPTGSNRPRASRRVPGPLPRSKQLAAALHLAEASAGLAPASSAAAYRRGKRSAAMRGFVSLTPGRR